MDSTNQTKLTLINPMSWGIFKKASVKFWEYDDISLKLYIDISKTGDVTKLVKVGRIENQQCLDKWEELIKRQEKETGTNNLGAYISLLKAYLSYSNDHEVIRASLILVEWSNEQKIAKDGSLVWVNLTDWKHVIYLKSKGHTIDFTTYDTMITTVRAALHKNENLVTKAVSKRKELEKMLAGKEEGKPLEFVDIMAQLNFAWPNPVSDDISLAGYNSYQKILKARQKAEENARRNNR